jgi:hypothetical protein
VTTRGDGDGARARRLLTIELILYTRRASPRSLRSPPPFALANG